MEFLFLIKITEWGETERLQETEEEETLWRLLLLDRLFWNFKKPRSPAGIEQYGVIWNPVCPVQRLKPNLYHVASEYEALFKGSHSYSSTVPKWWNNKIKFTETQKWKTFTVTVSLPRSNWNIFSHFLLMSPTLHLQWFDLAVPWWPFWNFISSRIQAHCILLLNHGVYFGAGLVWAEIPTAHTPGSQGYLGVRV